MTTAEQRPGINWASVEWKRAAACGDAGCVEVAAVAGGVAVRDSKRPEQAPLLFTVAEWRTFVNGVRDGSLESLSHSV